MTNYIYVLGTAGAGKSTLVKALSELIEDYKKLCITVNLDPGAEVIPYDPVVDIRDYITLKDVMEKYKLGPNGALVVAVDLTVNYLPEIKKIIENENADYVLIDTPGQLELFAYREVGIHVLNSFSSTPNKSLILFLVDPFLAKRVNTFVSLLLLASSIQARFFLPYLLLLSKVDLISQETLEKILEWSEDLSLLEEELNNIKDVSQREIALNILPIISSLNIPSLIPVSSLTNFGILELYSEIQRVLTKEDEISLE